MTLLVRLLSSAAALFIAARVVPGIRLGEGARLKTPTDWMTLLVVAVIFGVVNAVIWPVVFWLALPFTLATLGLFVLVVNALMFMLTSRITETLGLGFRVDGFVPAFAGGAARVYREPSSELLRGELVGPMMITRSRSAASR